MSTIEQAAKRLEELRRGLDYPAGTAVADASPPGVDADTVPTPEAVIRALEARADSMGSSGERASEAPSDTRETTIAREPLQSVATRGPALAPLIARTIRPRATPPRHLDIDLDRLKARGYVTPNAPQAQIADEFRVIKRPIIQNAFGKGGQAVRNGNLVMVTSALPGEGKTFTAVNLAMSIAMEYDSTVLLVDGDVAHPSLPGVLGVPTSPGLLDLLTQDNLDVGEALVKTNVEKLSIIPAGKAHRRATELLASEQMGQLLREIGSRYPDRIVLFDSPPLLATTEARVLASQMGQIVMVVAAQTTSHGALTQALATIESCEVVMMMLNKARQTEVGEYYYSSSDATV